MTTLTPHRPRTAHHAHRRWVTEVPPDPCEPPAPCLRLAGEDDEEGFEPHIFRGID
ncbi:hypothetical protein [Streptomyces sp. NPDC091209]|uniref:hypothetical protein n=1 Tax=Streptomyces sp. NPDC091209 TaxID=3365974 RepID=UPI0037FC4368